MSQVIQLILGCIIGLILLTVTSSWSVKQALYQQINSTAGEAGTDVSLADPVYTEGHCALMATSMFSRGFSVAERGGDRGLYCLPTTSPSRLPAGFIWRRFKLPEGPGLGPVLRRLDGSVDFYRPWAEYKAGFGNSSGEVWMGLDRLHTLTSTRPYGLHVTLEDWEGNAYHAYYSSFRVGPESDNYRMHVTGYDVTSTAGDSLTGEHHGMEFSTYDRDNDRYFRHCAVMYKAGWWFNHCRNCVLTGNYVTGGQDAMEGISWSSVPGRSKYYSFKSALLTLVP